VSWQGGAWVPDTSTWYHVVGVYDGNECYGYISGAVATPTYIGTAGAYNSDCTNNAALGCLDPGGSPTCYMTGNINDVAVYKRALSASEVAQLYNAGTCLYERSAMKGSVVIEGEVMNRKGATVPATHVRAGWWIQHTELAVKPIYISGHAVSMADKRNALTLGTDWMEEQIGVREAELLAIAPTPTTDPTDPTDPKKVWPGPYTPPPPPTPTPAPAPAPGPAPAPAHPTHRVYKGQLQVWKNGKWHNVGKGKPSSSDHARG
jgi:hypothetical protein